MRTHLVVISYNHTVLRARLFIIGTRGTVPITCEKKWPSKRKLTKFWPRMSKLSTSVQAVLMFTKYPIYYILL